MGTVVHVLGPREAILPATSYAQYRCIVGTNFPVESLAFDGAADEIAYFIFRAVRYGSGNLTIRIRWYADSTTSGDVIWGCQLACITPDTDTQDIETKAFDTAETVTDSHLGTTAQRLHEAVLTLTETDNIAADDWCVLKLYRDADAGGDTLNAIDALVVEIDIEYSDT